MDLVDIVSSLAEFALMVCILLSFLLHILSMMIGELVKAIWKTVVKFGKRQASIETCEFKQKRIKA